MRKRIENCRRICVNDYASQIKDIKMNWCGVDSLQLGNIKLTYTRTQFNGIRFWFICPNCQRRVSCLYEPEDGPLGCVACLEVIYPSQRLSARQKFAREYRVVLNSIEDSLEQQDLPRQTRDRLERYSNILRSPLFVDLVNQEQSREDDL